MKTLIALFIFAAAITSVDAHGQKHVCHQHGAHSFHCHR
jgi:hypothetical protein